MKYKHEIIEIGGGASFRVTRRQGDCPTEYLGKIFDGAVYSWVIGESIMISRFDTRETAWEALKAKIREERFEAIPRNVPDDLPRKGMTVEVYRPANDCYNGTTNNGITSFYHTVTLMGGGVAEMTEPTDDAPPLRLTWRTIRGMRDPYPTTVPMDAKEDGRNDGYGTGLYMFGGNYVKSSDSRFPFPFPIPVHDRRED